ncbi:MAG: glycosyltransferase family 2 protein [Flavobacteriales bacterium]|nr:glycosyltransferase family 2 protein [Flavobacteriales bacterium]
MKDPVSFARSEAPLVSVIIPSYNKRDYIVDTIASVQAQTYGNWELLVVDDVSTDGTVDLIREIAKSDPRISVDVVDKNSGANRCRNYGLAKAKGHYVIFLDADDQLAPHAWHSCKCNDPHQGSGYGRVHHARIQASVR